jgi:hypothetical protein
MAKGRSNQSIAAKLHISDKTVEACTGRIFSKLALEPGSDDHRRVRAVLAYLQATEMLKAAAEGRHDNVPAPVGGSHRGTAVIRADLPRRRTGLIDGGGKAGAG